MLLPTVQFLVVLILSPINERMARKAEYLSQEIRVLREALNEVKDLVGYGHRLGSRQNAMASSR